MPTQPNFLRNTQPGFNDTSSGRPLDTSKLTACTYQYQHGFSRRENPRLLEMMLYSAQAGENSLLRR